MRGAARTEAAGTSAVGNQEYTPVAPVAGMAVEEAEDREAQLAQTAAGTEVPPL
jgi:hypothetical protein